MRKVNKKARGRRTNDSLETFGGGKKEVQKLLHGGEGRIHHHFSDKWKGKEGTLIPPLYTKRGVQLLSKNINYIKEEIISQQR